MSTALFACTKCNSRHPFEELSQGEQLCKECRNVYITVKCTYCRSEFQQKYKGPPATICKKCEQNMKLYGKPTACEFCNVLAAFIGNKCQRCANSLKRYGNPSNCEQCRQKCAFNRRDDSMKKCDGKMLCYYCTLSYKRAVVKAKHNQTTNSSSNFKKRLSHSHRSSEPSSNSKKPRVDAKATNGNSPIGSFVVSDASPLARQSLEHFRESTFSDTTNSDHIVVVTQLKEQIASLQKLVSQKDQQLLAKERHISELKANHSSEERELRKRLQNQQKDSADQVQELQNKCRTLNKQIKTLSKSGKKSLGTTDSPASS